MSEAMVRASGEARQSMVRVWLAITGVWVTFWLVIAALTLAAVETRHPFTHEIASYAIIVLFPPLALLAVGTLARLTIDVSARLRR